MKSLILMMLIFGAGCSLVPEQLTDISEIRVDQTGLAVCHGQVFSGIAQKRNDLGVVIATNAYRHGLLEGYSYTYWPDGAVKTKRKYVNGLKHGVHLGYHADGSLRFLYEFKNGLSVGNHREWFPNGQLAEELNYADGHQAGSQKVWRSDGKLRSNYVIREDGRRYGLVGIKRCKNIDTASEQVKPLTASVYEKQ